MIIDTTKKLREFCKKIEKQPFIAVDTEFMREKTYYPIVCLIQIAAADTDLAACIDPIADDLDLTPLLDVMKNENVLKVFHSGRQDLEIFYQLMDALPTPVFDTQIGAMVCGLGESISYHGIVQHFLGLDLDKSSRGTDWSVRPLLEKQIQYAMGDVIHLVRVYEKIIDQLKEQNRLEWVSAAEGAKLAATMNDFVQTVTKLGENKRLEDLRCKK